VILIKSSRPVQQVVETFVKRQIASFIVSSAFVHCTAAVSLHSCDSSFLFLPHVLCIDIVLVFLRHVRPESVSLWCGAQ